MPFGAPIPPSPETSEAILAAFAERDIEFVPITAWRRSTGHGEAVLDDGRRLPFDLFLGIPVHRAPAVVEESGLTENGWIPVDPRTLGHAVPRRVRGRATSPAWDAEGRRVRRAAARVVADQLIARLRGRARRRATTAPAPATSSSATTGRTRRRRLLLDPGHPTGTFVAPSPETAEEKATSLPAGEHAGSEAERASTARPAYSCVSTTSMTCARGSRMSAPCTRSHTARSDASTASASDSVSNSRST